jgi:ATP-dependent exoDNAse (exonuclease V) beta subunit
MLVEGVLDLAFKERGAWVVVDFKTDEELRREANYVAQLTMYIRALRAATGEDATGVLLRL